MNITKNFTQEEFSCKCGCGFSDILPEIPHKLQFARNIIKRPIAINSGCRCPIHNSNQSGSKNSSHLTGMAADISCVAPSDRWDLLFALQTAGFTRIGISKSFIHVDVDNNKPQNIIWVY